MVVTKKVNIKHVQKLKDFEQVKLKTEKKLKNGRFKKSK